VKRFLILAAMVLLPLASAFSVNAGHERSSGQLRSFIGLWKGIDAVDGGEALRAFTCSRDGTCELVGTDAVVSLCNDEPGFITATGGLEGRALVFPDAVFHCSDGGAVSFSVRFERDRFNRTLVSSGVRDGTPFRSIIYYKISQ
jgi:hypothetical protein